MVRRSKHTFIQRWQIDGQKVHKKMCNISNYYRNSNKNYNEVSPHTTQKAIIKRLQKISAGEKKKGPSYTVNGNVNWCNRYGEQYGGALKTEYGTTIWSSNPTPGHISREDHNSKDTCALKSITALFTIAKTWKQAKCPSTEDWMKCIYILLSHKKHEIMPFATIWVDLGIIVVSEVKQRKDIDHMRSLICRIQ